MHSRIRKAFYCECNLRCNEIIKRENCFVNRAIDMDTSEDLPALISILKLTAEHTEIP